MHEKLRDIVTAGAGILSVQSINIFAASNLIYNFLLSTGQLAIIAVTLYKLIKKPKNKV